MSAGSKTNPGGYAEDIESLEQFSISDDRSPDQIANLLKTKGYDPVWKDWDFSYDQQRMMAKAEEETQDHSNQTVLIAN